MIIFLNEYKPSFFYKIRKKISFLILKYFSSNLISSLSKEYPPCGMQANKETRRVYPHSSRENLHFLRLAMYHGARRSIVVSRVQIPRARREYERESHGSKMMMFRGRENSLSLSSLVVVYRLADRSSSTSLAGNTNRDAKITFMSRICRQEGKREREEGGRVWHRVW